MTTLVCSKLPETARHNYLLPRKSQHREPRDNSTTPLEQDSHDHDRLRDLLNYSALNFQQNTAVRSWTLKDMLIYISYLLSDSQNKREVPLMSVPAS